MATLPTPRALLTSLLNTLTSYSPSTNSIPQPVNLHGQPGNDDDNKNPLKNLPSSHRALLTTLHVIIPPPTLLQALDLLDRRLVTRIVHREELDDAFKEGSKDGLKEGDGKVWPPQAHVHLPPSEHQSESVEDGRTGKGEKDQGGFFLVKSSQISKGRYKEREGEGTSYVVRLGAWNCSCAAFAFSAFPSSYSTFAQSTEAPDEMKYGEQGMEGEWEYGGKSLDGKRGEGVPICKHLLACLLGERWEDVLGGFVEKRGVGREEMVGLAVC